MTPAAFEAIAKLIGSKGKTKAAAKLVLVDGMRKSQAASQVGMTRQALQPKIASYLKAEKTILSAFIPH